MCSSSVTEFNELEPKSREAEKEVDRLQLKIQEASNNLKKLLKDMDCEFAF